MKPEIVTVEEKQLVGMNKKMTLQNDQTATLFKTFMPKRRFIRNKVDETVYCLKVFEDFKNFTPHTPFEKWAAVEVSSLEIEDEELKPYVLHGGTYAVFLHRGPAHTFHKTLNYFFDEWLPSSGYELDDREHFERMALHYNPSAPDAVEEVWVPVK